MAGWRRFLVAGIGALSLVGAGTISVAADGRGDRLIEFDSMTPITGSAVGAVNDRGITGGGAPWSIVSGSGSVDRQGDVSVTVTGLIVAPLGRNPIGTFEAVVSCVTPHGIVNVETSGFAATMPGGDSTINAKVALPHPCKDPEVFVGGSPRGTFIWFARSNAEDDD